MWKMQRWSTRCAAIGDKTSTQIHEEVGNGTMARVLDLIDIFNLSLTGSMSVRFLRGSLSVICISIFFIFLRIRVMRWIPLVNSHSVSDFDKYPLSPNSFPHNRRLIWANIRLSPSDTFPGVRTKSIRSSHSVITKCIWIHKTIPWTASRIAPSLRILYAGVSVCCDIPSELLSPQSWCWLPPHNLLVQWHTIPPYIPASLYRKGFRIVSIHGDKSQQQRSKAKHFNF